MLVHKALRAFVAGVLLTGALVIGLNQAAAAAERRVALIMGVGDYATLPDLPNPRKDALALSGSLQKLGFEVIQGVDLNRDQFEARIDTFAERLEGADVALLYYSGHGVQRDGVNYLLPTDANIKTAEDLDLDGLHLEYILSRMYKETSMNLVFLDACRNNPFSKQLLDGRSQGAGDIFRGLAPMRADAGTLIAFATEPDNVAYDGGGENSPFTAAILRHIGSPDISISDMMVDVRRDVIRETDGLQIPWEHSSLTRRFAFAGADADLARGAIVAVQEPEEAGVEERGAVTQSVWDHNGSDMLLRADGQRRVFTYLKPRPGIAQAGVKEGDLLIAGKRVGFRFEGTAYIFKPGCPPAGYFVSGQIDPQKQTELVLTGKAPVRVNNGCNVIGYTADSRNATLKFSFKAPL